MPPAQALPDTVLARIVRDKAFRQACFAALQQAKAAGTRAQQIQEMNAQLDQLRTAGTLSQSERAAISAADIIDRTPQAAEAALQAIDNADSINAA